MIKAFKYLLVIIWMIVIYQFSAQNAVASSNLSNGLLYKIAHILNITDTKTFILNNAHFIRKFAHFFEYFILGILVCNAIESKNIKRIIFTILFCVVYAYLDETHQLFVDGRAFALKDVLIDSCGSAVGIILLHLLKNVTKRKSN